MLSPGLDGWLAAWVAALLNVWLVGQFFPKQSLAVGVLAVLVGRLVDFTGHRAPSEEANSL